MVWGGFFEGGSSIYVFANRLPGMVSTVLKNVVSIDARRERFCSDGHALPSLSHMELVPIPAVVEERRLRNFSLRARVLRHSGRQTH